MNTNNKQGSTLVIVLALIAILAVGGVVAYFATDGFSSNDTAETQTTNNTASGGDSGQAEREDESQAELPSDFPEFVPIYQPSSATTVNTSPGAGQTNYVATFSTEDSRKDVVDFYEQELSSNGWSIVMSNDNGRFTASNDGTTIVVDVIEAGDGAVFAVTAPQE